MHIVDAQVHTWSRGRVVTPANAHHRQAASFTGTDLLGEMDEAGVSAAILIPPLWGSNDDALADAQRYPDRFAVMGKIPFDDPDAPAKLAAWKGQPGMLGVRLTFNPETRARLLDGSVDWVWTAAERADVPLMVLAPGLLDRIAAVAERHPGLRLTIDHLGVARHAKDDAAFDHLPALLKLARLPNVSVKATGLPSYSSEPYPFRRLRPYIEQTLDAFGPQRVFWGTDLTKAHCSYRQCVTHFTEELPFLSDSDKAWVMGRGIREWLRWSAPASP